MILNDPLSKTATIPLKFEGGEFINRLTDKAVSGIQEGASCELIVDAYKVEDQILLNLLNDETEIELLSEGIKLYAIVNSEKVPERLRGDVVSTSNISVGAKGSFVQLSLLEPLRMMLRGTKLPSLFECECHITSLNKNADSLNHAYTLISTDFEPHRRSHTGNVFSKIYFQSTFNDYTRGYWIELDRLRLAKLDGYFTQLSARYKQQRAERRERVTQT